MAKLAIGCVSVHDVTARSASAGTTKPLTERILSDTYQIAGAARNIKFQHAIFLESRRPVNEVSAARNKSEMVPIDEKENCQMCDVNQAKAASDQSALLV